MVPDKILVVDDEEDLEFLIRRKFKKEIQKQEFFFLFARDGKEGLQIMKNQSDISVVLTDINMPGMDGITLLEELKKLNGFFQTIIVSARDDIKSIRHSMNLGAFDFLIKPINFIDMGITIRKTLKLVNHVKNNHLETMQALQDLKETEVLLKKEELSRLSLQNTNKLKDELISFMAHEVRTPLNTILANVRLMEIAQSDDSFLKEEQLTQQDLINRVKHGGENLIHLTQRMLDIQRLEAGKLQMHFHSVDLNQLLRDEIFRLTAIAPKRNNQLTFVSEVESPYNVQIDEIHFTQMIQNLVENALKFTKDGLVTVKLSQTERYACIKIEDNGCGIESENLNKIFERFEQLQRKSHEQQGTGLGLTYSKYIAELHGGTIAVKSEKNVGSIFSVEIPR